MRKSKGHVCFIDRNFFNAGYLELLHGPDGTLYTALEANPLDLDGYRVGARFECEPRVDAHQYHIEKIYGFDVINNRIVS
jgi:hypothetical protein